MAFALDAASSLCDTLCSYSFLLTLFCILPIIWVKTTFASRISLISRDCFDRDRQRQLRPDIHTQLTAAVDIDSADRHHSSAVSPRSRHALR